MLEFILERYNYWIVIILMMTGLYTVISRGNLVKKIIGLNLFQTSVFIFYISIGKIIGGTAPILVGGHGDGHGESHGDGHGDGHSGDHSAEAGHASEAGHGASASHEVSHDGPELHADSLHTAQALSDDKISNLPANDLDKAALKAANDHGAEHGADDVASAGESLHATPESDALAHSGAANDHLIDGADKIAGSKIEGNDFNMAEVKDQLAAMKEGASADAHGAADKVSEAAGGHGIDITHGAGEIAETIYTNPLPHVLILTAIVVGVATTAVGLALAVRIREAYGTIEEDELIADDLVAEFGGRGKAMSQPSSQGGAA